MLHQWLNALPQVVSQPNLSCMHLFFVFCFFEDEKMQLTFEKTKTNKKKNSGSIQVDFLNSSWHLQLYLVLLSRLLCWNRAAWKIHLLLQLITSKPEVTCYRLYPKKTPSVCLSVWQESRRTHAEIKPIMPVFKRN